MVIYGLTRRSRGLKRMAPKSRQPRRRQPVVVVQTNQPRRRRGRRGRRRANPPRGIVTPRPTGFNDKLTFSQNDLQANGTGKLTFGKSLSEHSAFSNGLLLAFHEYKITKLRVQYQPEASSTSAGSISFELDPHCKLSTLESKINKFPITQKGSRTWTAGKINGLNWIPSDSDQFRFLWKGNGSSVLAGSFLIEYWVQAQNPK